MGNTLVIIGSSGQARVVIDIVEKNKEFEIFGLIDSFRTKNEKEMGYSILGDLDVLKDLNSKNNINAIHVAIGNNWFRNEITEQVCIQSPNLNLPTLIHPSAVIAKNVEIGAGSVIMAGACIGVNSKIGKCCIVNTNSSIDHDTNIGDYSSIGPGCNLGGELKIGSRTAIGIGSTVKHRINIGNDVLIGAHSYVNFDVVDGVVAFGVPARVKRSVVIGEKYL